MCFAAAGARDLGNAWSNAVYVTTACHHIQLFSNDTSFVCNIVFPLNILLTQRDSYILRTRPTKVKPKRLFSLTETFIYIEASFLKSCEMLWLARLLVDSVFRLEYAKTVGTIYDRASFWEIFSKSNRVLFRVYITSSKTLLGGWGLERCKPPLTASRVCMTV